TSIKTLVSVEGHRWAIKDSFETAKNEFGLDHNESRSWHGWHRHVSLVMLAFAMMAAIQHQANKPTPKKNKSSATPRHPSSSLGRVDEALGYEIDAFAVLGIEAVPVLVLIEDLADDNRGVFARIDGDLARRPGERLAHDLHAGLLVVVLCAYLLQYVAGAQECD